MDAWDHLLRIGNLPEFPVKQVRPNGVVIHRVVADPNGNTSTPATFGWWAEQNGVVQAVVRVAPDGIVDLDEAWSWIETLFPDWTPTVVERQPNKVKFYVTRGRPVVPPEPEGA